MSAAPPSFMPANAARRDFLRQGGALLVGLSLAACMAPRTPRHATQAAPDLRPGPPDAAQIDTWLAIHEDSTATLYIGFAELGQGATTALLQVAAEELDLGMDQIRAAPLDTHRSPNQGGTYSSAAVQRGRPQIAAAAAHARAALLALAAPKLGTTPDALRVERGVVSAAARPGRKVRYGELIGGARFDLRIEGTPTLKPVRDYRLVARPVPRPDLAARVHGTHRYIQHLRLPGMLHGRIVRPRGQSHYGAGARVLSLDEQSVAHIPDVQIVRRADFIGVLAPREWDAVRAAQQLRVEWGTPTGLPDSERLHEHMRRRPTIDNTVLERGDTVIAVDEPGITVVAFQGFGPYQAHAPFAPNCALADIRDGEGLVICSSQDIYTARRGIATLLGLPQDKLRVQFAEGAGTYGHSCYDDAAQAAALMSLLAGQPVRVQFMRWDEHGWDTYGPPHVGEARVAAGADGRLVAYDYHGWQHNWSQVETTAQLAGAAPAEWPPVAVQGVNPLVCGGMYEIPNLRLVNHRLPGLEYLRGAWLRSPLDLSFAFVSEQAIDMLATELAADPFAFRQRNIRDARWRGVLEAAAEAAGWSGPWTPGRTGSARLRRGRGIALGTHLVSYGAAVAEIEVDMQTGVVRILRLTAALDAGLVVNPLIVERQIEGQMVQTASRMLLEEVRFDAGRVTSLDWQGYPILRFADCPEIRAVVVQRTDERSTGAGEETMAAAAAAIANAFFDATGRRMNRYPFLPERVLETLRAR